MMIQMQPNTIPSDFFHWMIKTARVPKEILEMNLKLNREKKTPELNDVLRILDRYKGTEHAYKIISNLPLNPPVIPW